MKSFELSTKCTWSVQKTLQKSLLFFPIESPIAFVLFQGDLSVGTSVLYDYLHTEPTKLMLLGPFDNDLAKTVAAYAGQPEFGVLQVKITVSVIPRKIELCSGAQSMSQTWA